MTTSPAPQPADGERESRDLRDYEDRGGQWVFDQLTFLADEWVARDRHEEADLLLQYIGVYKPQIGGAQ